MIPGIDLGPEFAGLVCLFQFARNNLMVVRRDPEPFSLARVVTKLVRFRNIFGGESWLVDI